MAKTQGKKTTKGLRNDERKNGKANKKNPGSRGSRRTKLTDGEKVLLGQGMFRKWDTFNKEQALTMRAKNRRTATADDN